MEVGSWSIGATDIDRFWVDGQEVGEILCTRGGYYAFVRGKLLRTKPYHRKGDARLRVEQECRRKIR